MNLRDAGIYDITNLFKGEATNKHSGAATSGSIINREKSRIINIPAYQRPYRWDRDKIDTLFEDYYSENSGEYFLGSAVAVEKNADNGVVSFDLVDGQQRVTTLYLLNYIRFLLLRYRMQYIASQIPDSGDLSQYFDEMSKSYIDFVGKNNGYRFNELKSVISSLNYVDREKKPVILKEAVTKWLCLAEEKNKPEETIAEIKKRMQEFFNSEELSLSYSRKKCTEYLKSALCRVFLIKEQYTTNLLLEGTNIDKTDPLYNNIKTYLEAMECLYKNICEHAVEGHNELETINNLVAVANELVENLSLCIVVTNNEDDANKLFEVLNDRALDIEDLELIKNHFYKEYYTKSNEARDIIDRNIEELDNLWVDNIFSGLGDAPSNTISFFATVYFTSKKEVDDKHKADYKRFIDKVYTKDLYNNRTRPYTYDLILRDFNVYLAIKILLQKIQYYDTGSNMERTAIEAQKDNTKSVTYKTLCLLGEKKQKAVMAGIINMILAYYWHSHTTFTQESYRAFLDGLFNDSTNRKEEYKNIHQQSRIIRIASIKCKDYKIPRGIAVRVIEGYGAKIPFSERLFEMNTTESDKLKNEFRDWYYYYSYSSSNPNNTRLKILFLDLLSWIRTSPDQDAYKANRVKIRPSACSYQFDAKLLHLDHLEPQNMNPSVSQYFMKDNEEQRLKIINGNVGNFMILDAKENIEKQNDPMIFAVQEHYEIMKDIWLVQDILNMMKDETFFDLQNGIPKEEFFKFRTDRLYKYFDAILNAQLYTEGEEIVF